ncbi:hypothetical protein [Foetidibacter luteolus]|uniref:hypothetical protein n=1 Tax=Foetidibacter luteolus TaxID=2608880 RepID=UPI00129AEE02|nr:hypothetical protein [Foetidibacter luteolus]
MEGVILFADDHIHTEKSGEKELFESLRNDFPVLGVQNLEHAEKALVTMSGFNAIILDWDFNSSIDSSSLDITEEIGDENIKIARPAVKENATMDFLRRNDFYTLLYIFSNVDVKAIFPEELMKKFAGRIQFVQKGDLSDTGTIHAKIVQDIIVWQKSNANLAVPIKWSNSINQSLQQIFSELAAADINWVLNLHETASSDGVNPEIEVISLLQNILTEKLIANPGLLAEIKNFATQAKPNTDVLADGNSIARLFQRIYYTNLNAFSLDDVPVMTGDVFLLAPQERIYGIIISPECDCQDICNSDLYFELLTFQESGFTKQIFTDLFGQKNTKVIVDNAKVISAIKDIAREKFVKFNADSKPPALYSKSKKKIPVTDAQGNTTYQKEENYEMITEDVLIKPFLSQFEALVNKHIGPGLRTAINEQISEQNTNLLNDLFLQAYNQTEKRLHLIPSFNFETEYPNKTAVIDFRTGKTFRKYAELKVQGVQRICKLNHPFISELRQRYNSYYGRVGVPKIPTILREYNIESFTR